MIDYTFVLSNSTLRAIINHPYWSRCHEVAQGCNITTLEHNRANHQVFATNIMKQLLDKSHNLREEFQLGLMSRILTHDVGHAFPTSHGVEYYKLSVSKDPITIPLWTLNHEQIGKLITKEIYSKIDYNEIVTPVTHEEEICNDLIESSTVDADRLAYIYYDSIIYNSTNQFKSCYFTIEEAVRSFDCTRGFDCNFIVKLLDYRNYLYQHVYPSQPRLDLSRYDRQLEESHQSINNFCNHWCKLEDIVLDTEINSS